MKLIWDQMTRIIIAAVFITFFCSCSSSSSSSSSSTPTPSPTNPIIRLFYYGQNFPPASTHKMYSATSSDGIAFTEESGVRFSLDESLTDPDTFYDGSKWVMLTSLGSQLIRATSATANGTYEQDTDFSWNSGGVCSTTLMDSTYRTFYCDNTTGGIGVAEYDPGTGTLTTSGNALANTHGSGGLCDPSVINRGDGTYIMFYKHDRCGEGESGPVCHDIYTATSTNGTSFTATGTKICEQCSVPGAVYIEGVIYLYFVDGSGTYQALGVGISNDNGTTFEFTETTFSGTAESQQVDPDPVVYQ